MGLEISPSGTFESALYYRTGNNTWEFEDSAGVHTMAIHIDDQQIEIPDGTKAAPTIGFNSDLDTGIYQPGANDVGIAAGGACAAQFVGTFSAFQATGTTAGSVARLDTVTVNSESMKVLYFDNSSRDIKADIQSWGLTDDEFKAIRPVSYIGTNGAYIGPDGEHRGCDMVTNEDGSVTTLPPPTDALPIRRFGFILEELWGVHLGLTNHVAPDDRALIAGTIGKVQELMARVEALESA